MQQEMYRRFWIITYAYREREADAIWKGPDYRTCLPTVYLIGMCGFAARPSVFANAAPSAVRNQVRVSTALFKSAAPACCLRLGEQLDSHCQDHEGRETSLPVKWVRDGLQLCISRGNQVWRNAGWEHYINKWWEFVVKNKWFCTWEEGTLKTREKSRWLTGKEEDRDKYLRFWGNVSPFIQWWFLHVQLTAHVQ